MHLVDRGESRWEGIRLPWLVQVKLFNSFGLPLTVDSKRQQVDPWPEQKQSGLEEDRARFWKIESI